LKQAHLLGYARFQRALLEIVAQFESDFSVAQAFTPGNKKAISFEKPH